MSYFKGVGNGSNSYGQLWFGGSKFPGFLYKKNTGVGGKKILNMVSSATGPLRYGIHTHLVLV